MNYLTVNPSKICRDKLHSEIYSQEEVKKYQAVYTKRVIQTDLSTVPYGFLNICEIWTVIVFESVFICKQHECFDIELPLLFLISCRLFS